MSRLHTLESSLSAMFGGRRPSQRRAKPSSSLYLVDTDGVQIRVIRTPYKGRMIYEAGGVSSSKLEDVRHGLSSLLGKRLRIQRGR